MPQSALGSFCAHYLSASPALFFSKRQGQLTAVFGKWFCAGLVCAWSSTAAAQTTSAPPLVPQPVTETLLAGPPVSIARNTVIVVESQHNDPKLIQAAHYLGDFLRLPTGYPLPVTQNSQRATQNPAIILKLVDPSSAAGQNYGPEGYSLNVQGNLVTLQAATPNGIFFGSQTLFQLLPPEIYAHKRQTGPWVLPAVAIFDKPRFPYRGAMLDVARRFYPVYDVKRFIDQMAMFKFNRLHIHLADDQGWRIAIAALPELTKTGAITQSGMINPGHPLFYSRQQYQEIVRYAASRFITVVPEIDGPGHVSAAQASIPGLNCNNQALPPYDGFDTGISLLCLQDAVHVNNVRQYLNTVIPTLAQMTPGQYIHVGGDETPSATTEEYDTYVSLASAAVSSAGKDVMGWHQLGQGSLPGGAVMQYWGDDNDRSTIGSQAEGIDVTQAREGAQQGAQFVFSPADHAYLDMKYDNSSPYGLMWEGFVNLQKAYTWDPTTELTSLDGKIVIVSPEQIIGLEGTLWADRAYKNSTVAPPPSLSLFVPPSVYEDYMAFPKIAAIAEIGWSPLSTHDWNSFSTRIADQSPKWEADGIGYNPTTDIPWQHLGH